MRLNYGNVKNTIARVLGKHPDSPEVLDYTNEAQARLLTRGDWRGTIVRYRVAVQDAKLTWPRWIEAIRKVNVCGKAQPIASRWYEFVGIGPGNVTDDSLPGLSLIDMQEAPIFADISGANKRLHVISNRDEDDDTWICVQGYNENNEWIRTELNGEEVDGEYIQVGSAGAYSTSVYANIAAVRKDSTVGVVTLSEYEVVDGSPVFAPLGRYENDETNPLYRRSRIPGLEFYKNDGEVQVQVQAKLRHIQIVRDKDWLIIGNLPALKDMVMSIVKAEKNLAEESEYYESRAIRELERELANHHLGETMPTHDVQNLHIWGNQVEGVI